MAGTDAFGEPLLASELLPGEHFGARRARRGGEVWLALAGDLDIFATPRLRRELRLAEAEPADTLVIDLRGITFIDSSGLAVILSAHERAEAGRRRLRLLARGSEAVEALFERIGAHDALDVADGSIDARAASDGDARPVASGASG